MTELPIRVGTADDRPAITELLATVFHSTFEAEDSWGGVFEPERSLLIEDDGALVAHTGAFTRELTVPGGPVPATHVTMVGVAPTHRRRGLLSRLMHRQLSEAPEPVAVLWASEGPIYPRFGYGMASQVLSVRADTREVRLPEPAAPGRLRLIPLAEAHPVLAPVYEAVRPHRPGWSSRPEPWWTARNLADPPDRRDGATQLRVTLHENADGTVDGYALWRTKSGWDEGGPKGEVRVKEVVATTPDAHLALWRFLLGIDLTRSASLHLGAPDEPLLHLADAPDRLRTTLGAGLYVRIVDLPAALTARRYAAGLDLVLEVTDSLLPANSGRWQLVAGPDKTSCTPTSAPADLACTITELGSAYLGGSSLAALAAAGRVTELRPGTLAPASTAFGWHRAPAGMEIF